MDTTDPDIVFDEQGVCNHCHDHLRLVKQKTIEGRAGLSYLEKTMHKIIEEGRRKPYDCVLGISGGVDSTYSAYVVKKYGARPLAVHVDNGWDSELAVKNVEQTLNKLGIDLYTHVIDWEEFKDLQVAFLRASTPDSEIPSDHAINAVLGNVADKYGLKYIISGANVKTETHLPRAWSYGHFDWKYIRNIHKKFGRARLISYPHTDLFTYYRRLLTQHRIDILNYIDYNKTLAMKVLEEELGWRYYGGKHFESTYTRFFQGYILPVKFGFDKRRSHLSSLVCSGEITREAAKLELDKPTYSPVLQEEDREYVIKKLGLTDREFDEIMNAPKKTFWQYPSYSQVLEGPLFGSYFTAARNLYRRIQKKQHSGI